MKRNTLTQEGQERINKALMPQSWKDDAMPSLSDNNSMEEEKPLWPEEQPLDANQIEDYDDMEEHPVLDYLGRIKGMISTPRRKKRKKT